jgi:hypothetical protein
VGAFLVVTRTSAPTPAASSARLTGLEATIEARLLLPVTIGRPASTSIRNDPVDI